MALITADQVKAAIDALETDGSADKSVTYELGGWNDTAWNPRSFGPQIHGPVQVVYTLGLNGEVWVAVQQR